MDSPVPVIPVRAQTPPKLLKQPSRKKRNIIKSEIRNVLSTMRLNSRWASDERFEKEITSNPPLVAEFNTLLNQLSSFDGARQSFVSIDDPPHSYLRPFLNVISHANTNSAITLASLSAVNKFLLYGFIKSTSFDEVNTIASHVIDCKFESTYSTSDEIVLMQLLDVLVNCLRCAGGRLITDANAFQIFETCFEIVATEAFSELLRRTAAKSLTLIVCAVFSNISNFEEKGYSALTLRNILTFLADLLKDPATRNFSLRLVNVAIETGGESLNDDEEIVRVLGNDLSKHILRCTRSDNLTVLSIALRSVFNLFAAIKDDFFKVQLEVFLTSAHLRILSSPSSSAKEREAVLESLLDFCREPAVMVDLYRNYDCDLGSTNLFENLFSSCVSFCDSDSAMNALSALGLDCVLAVISSLQAACEGSVAEEESVFVRNKALKRRIERVVALFNKKPCKRGWIDLALEQDVFVEGGFVKGGFAEDGEQDAAVAAFLRKTPGLDPKQVGEHLSDEKCSGTLDAYLSTFDFSGMQIDAAMRLMLTHFRLPGEAQRIDRIMETFSNQYFESYVVGNGVANLRIASKSATNILAFALIMLHTDLHNDNIKQENKMTCEQFKRNLRGTNDGEDFDPEFLEEIYTAIGKEQIRLTSEAPAEQTWDLQILRSRFSEGEVAVMEGTSSSAGNAAAIQDIFKMIVTPSLQSLAWGLCATSDEMRAIDAVAGFKDLISISSHYQLRDDMDDVLICLCKQFEKMISFTAPHLESIWRTILDICATVWVGAAWVNVGRCMSAVREKLASARRERAAPTAPSSFWGMLFSDATSEEKGDDAVLAAEIECLERICTAPVRFPPTSGGEESQVKAAMAAFASLRDVELGIELMAKLCTEKSADSQDWLILLRACARAFEGGEDDASGSTLSNSAAALALSLLPRAPAADALFLPLMDVVQGLLRIDSSSSELKELGIEQQVTSFLKSAASTIYSDEAFAVRGEPRRDVCFMIVLRLLRIHSSNSVAFERLLSHCLLSPEITAQLSPALWSTIFDEILFPMTKESSAHMPLMARALLVNVDAIAAGLPAEFHVLWLRVVTAISKDLADETSDLFERAFQCMQNVLQVMLLHGALAHVEAVDVWRLTVDVIENASSGDRIKSLLEMIAPAFVADRGDVEGKSQVAADPGIPS